MDYKEIEKLDKEYVMQTYARYPIALTHGQGCRVWDTEGKEYLDLIAGIAVCALGHGHPKLAEAITEQAKELMHVSNLFYTEKQVILAKKLSDLAPMDTKTFFCNSGAEANESAIKFARKATGRREIIAMSNSFHGRTIGSLAITDKKKYQKPFEPLMPETQIVGYGDIEDIKAKINDNTAAIFVELLQGEGGIKTPKKDFGESKEYFAQIRELCDARDIIMVVDEVQSGGGRTGTYFACEQFEIRPDMITCAKGIAGGFPMGATLVTDKISSAIDPGDHASTFGGNPLACAAALATIDTIEEESLMDNAKSLGRVFIEELKEYGARGLGLMMGVEAGSEEIAKKIMIELRGEGILVNVTGGNVIRLVPPLILSKEELQIAIDALKDRL